MRPRSTGEGIAVLPSGPTISSEKNNEARKSEDFMSKAQILQEIVKLTPADRIQSAA